MNQDLIYAVGDIHGMYTCLASLITKIRNDYFLKYRDLNTAPKLLFIGDYIDRGQSSKEVIDFLLNGFDNIQTIFLKGNHEEIFLNAIKSKNLEGYERWLYKIGGQETLSSYGIENIHSNLELSQFIPKDHLVFFENLKLCYETKDYFFVHAGINPQRSLNQQLTNEMLWIREPFLSSQSNHNKIIIHGHTPCGKYPDIKFNQINIDTGAYDTKILSCLVVDSKNKELRVIQSD